MGVIMFINIYTVELLSVIQPCVEYVELQVTKFSQEAQDAQKTITSLKQDAIQVRTLIPWFEIII